MATIKSLPSYYSPIGFQKLTVSSSPVSFTLPVLGIQVRAVLFTLENNAIRMRADGTPPDASTGLIIYPGDIVELLNVDLINKAQFIAVAGDGLIQIHYFGGGV